MKLNVPYYSQYRDVKDKGWQKRVCSIVCLKMILDYYKNQGFDCDSPCDIENLIEEGIFIKGLDENRYWKQDRIIWLLHNHGIGAYGQEFKSFKIDLKNKEETENVYADAMLKDGVIKIINELNSKNPVLVSVVKKFKYPDKFHQVVLTGFKNDDNGKMTGFYYNDPDCQNEDEGKNIFVSIKVFEKYWRRIAIFIHRK